MTSERGHLLDTSVFIGAEQSRLDRVTGYAEGEARISVATVTELRLGVALAAPGPARELRERTLVSAGSFVALAYDELVAARLAELMAALRAQRRRVAVMDAIIAATALVHDLTVWTLDGDFERLAAVEPELRLFPA